HDEEMSVENPCVLRPDRLGDPFLHLENLGTRLEERGLESRDLARDLRRVNPMARDLVAIVVDDVERAPGNAGGNADALEAHFLFRVIAAHPERIARMSTCSRRPVGDAGLSQFALRTAKRL